MGTRAVICGLRDGEMRGRYHHWDGYPSGLGKSLWDQVHGHFQGDVNAALRYYVDEHPAGWSSLTDCDLNIPAGFVERGEVPKGQPQCYCHGDRHEDPNLYDSPHGEQWGYLLDPLARTLTVYGSYGQWAVDLDGPEPNWKMDFDDE